MHLFVLDVHHTWLVNVHVCSLTDRFGLVNFTHASKIICKYVHYFQAFILEEFDILKHIPEEPLS